MPQCARCGREISDYGLCAKCAKELGVNAAYDGDAFGIPVCPNCGSMTCQPIARDTFRCCECDCEFSEDEDY